MSVTPSTMAPLGMKAPDFTLSDTEGERVSLDDFGDADALLVVFMCNHCPYVKHLKPALAGFARDYRDRGLAVVGINANDPDHDPRDGLEGMRKDVERFDYPFPYLVDETQEVAKDYGAACTPDFFLFDGERELVYRGQFDDTRPGGAEPTGADLRAAAAAVLAGEEVPEEQQPSVGCNIKWKPGNEPGYAGG